MKRCHFNLSFLVLLVLSSCNHSQKEKNLCVKYDYDYRLSKVGKDWIEFNYIEARENWMDSLDKANKSLYSDSSKFDSLFKRRFGGLKFIRLTSLDSINFYDHTFKNSKGMEKDFELVLCDSLDNDRVKVSIDQNELLRRKISRGRSTMLALDLTIEKTKSNQITLSINKFKTAKVNLDYRFDYGYIGLERDSVSITFTNYARDME